MLDIAGERLSAEGRNFVRVLVDADRITLLPEIAGLFDALKDGAEGTAKAEIESAFPLIRVVGPHATHFRAQGLGGLPGRLPAIAPEALGPICRFRRRDRVPVAVHERTNVVRRHRGIVARGRARPAR